MQQNLQQQMKKQAEEAKSFMKVQNGKEVKHTRQNVFKSLTKPKNKNCQNFVVLNKRKNFEKFGGNILESIQEFGNKGFYFNNF